MAVRHRLAALALGLAVVSPASARTAAAPWPVAYAPASPKYAHLGPPGGYFPDHAARTGVGGAVVVDCLIGEGGALDDCKVASESPTRYGFGDAALQMARRRAISAGLVDGQLPAVGERRALRVDFPRPGRPPCPPGSRRRHC